jgi:multidrug efflux pump subunit AcrA (membrane-fusion protein)
MRFQGKIEIDRIEETLLIPLEAVFSTPDGPVAYRRTLTGLRETALKLGRRNDTLAEVIEGLSAGDRVSTRLPRNEAS